MRIRRMRRALAAVVVVGALMTASVALAANRPGGTLPPVVTALTEQEAADLQFMREEEKLAHDVYVELYEAWNMRIFKNIAASEQRHTDAVKALIEKYGIEDPAALTAPGVFVDVELQGLYDYLIEKGLTSPADAIEVGVLIEEADIADLKEVMSHTTKADILQVYGNLLAGSYSHLAAFTR